MTTPFEDLIRSTFSERAQEALPVNLTPRAVNQVRHRRTTMIVLSAATAVAAVLIGAPLALAATNNGTPPAAPAHAPVPSPSTAVPVPSPSTAVPVPSPSLNCAASFALPPYPAPGTPCYLVPIPSPKR